MGKIIKNNNGTAERYLNKMAKKSLKSNDFDIGRTVERQIIIKIIESLRVHHDNDRALEGALQAFYDKKIKIALINQIEGASKNNK